MGYYTEIIFGARLREDTPGRVIELLTKAADGGWDVEADDVKLGRVMHGSDSYYFSGSHAPVFELDDFREHYTLHFRANLKNYSSEIEAFIDWIRPYVAQGAGEREVFAIVMGEDTEALELHCLEG
jgi:hypothetical protein